MSRNVTAARETMSSTAVDILQITNSIMTTLCFLSDKKLTYQLTMYRFKGLCVNFSINKLCLTLSKAFEKSIVNSLTARLSLLSKAWRNPCCICITPSCSVRKLVVIQVTLHSFFTEAVIHIYTTRSKSPSNYQCNADSPKVLRLDWNVYFG